MNKLEKFAFASGPYKRRVYRNSDIDTEIRGTDNELITSTILRI